MRHVEPVLGVMRTHGGLDDRDAALPGAPFTDTLDFSVSCNPYGPAPSVVRAVRAAALDRYPDPTGRRARAALARHLAVPADAIALGNGACELLWTLSRALVRSGSAAVVVEPTFSEFRAALEHDRAEVHEWRAESSTGFAIDLGAVERRVRETASSLVYLCSPNTPTGTYVPATDVAALARSLYGVTWVLDQSFLALSDRSSDAGVPMPENVVCVRSMTKEHALPGVRIGYALGRPGIIASIEHARSAWTTSAMAQAAVIAACEVPSFVAESRARLLEDRAHTARMLGRLGLETAPSSTNFLIARVRSACRLHAALLERHGILVRNCASFALPEWIRIAARPERERERLGAALREELARC